MLGEPFVERQPLLNGRPRDIGGLKSLARQAVLPNARRHECLANLLTTFHLCRGLRHNSSMPANFCSPATCRMPIARNMHECLRASDVVKVTVVYARSGELLVGALVRIAGKQNDVGGEGLGCERGRREV